MNGLTEWGVVGVIVVLVGLAGTVVTWTNASNKKWAELQSDFNEHWSEVSKNLAENTLAIKELRFYLDKVESDIERRLKWHESVLNKHEEVLGEHRERITKIESSRGKKENDDD